MNRLVDTFVVDAAVYNNGNKIMRVLGAGKVESKPRPEGRREETVGVPLTAVVDGNLPCPPPPYGKPPLSTTFAGP